MIPLSALIYEALDYMENTPMGVFSTKTRVRTLRVFDFDDTLVKTNSRVGITEFDKTTGEQIRPQYLITPGAYATFKKEVAAKHPDIEYKYDYSEFKRVVEPKIIDLPFGILRKIVGKLREEPGAPAVVLTARGHEARDNIREFLSTMKIDIPVVTLDSSNPNSKSDWIKKAMLTKDIPYVEFFDDSRFNVAAVESLKSDPELQSKFGAKLRIKTRLVKA